MTDRRHELKELDNEIDQNLDELLGIASTNKEKLDQQNQIMNKIEHSTLNKIENENKKSSWYVNGIKSTGSWFKNLFSTPTMKSTKIPEDTKDKKATSDNNVSQNSNKLDNLVGIVKTNGQTINEQDERLRRIDDRIQRENQKMEKMNKDINKIIKK